MPNPLILLLKRDLRLHWGALLVPLVLVLCHVAMGGFNRDILISINMEIFFVALLPMALQLREVLYGTLGDLAALPVSRSNIVQLRYLEVIIFASLVILISDGGAWIVLHYVWHQPASLLILSGEYQFSTALILLTCFGGLLPIFLRWGPIGIGVAYGLFSVLSVVGAFIVVRLPVQKAEAFTRCVDKIVLHLGTHPGQVLLGFVALFALSYILSLKAFAGRDL